MLMASRTIYFASGGYYSTLDGGATIERCSERRRLRAPLAMGGRARRGARRHALVDVRRQNLENITR